MRRCVPAAASIARPKRRKKGAVRRKIGVVGLPGPYATLGRDQRQAQVTGGPSLRQSGADLDDPHLPGAPEGHPRSVALVAPRLLPGRDPGRRAEVSAITEETEMIRATAASAGERRIGLPLRPAMTGATSHSARQVVMHSAATKGPMSIKEASHSGQKDVNDRAMVAAKDVSDRAMVAAKDVSDRATADRDVPTTPVGMHAEMMSVEGHLTNGGVTTNRK
jgi:hypothetical protein